MAASFAARLGFAIVLAVGVLLVVDTFVVDVPGALLVAALCLLGVVFLVSESSRSRSFTRDHSDDRSS
jgi:hypothetical protein